MRIPHPTRSLTVAFAQLYIFPHFPKFLRNLSAQPNFYLRSTHQLHRSSTMAGESESFATSAEDYAKYGFERAEMHQSKLAGTVDPYDRHLFLPYKSSEDWPSRVEDSDSDPWPKLFAAALKARKNDMKLKTRLTIIEERYDANLLEGDVLIFSETEMIMYRGLTDSEVDSFVEEVLVKGKLWGVREQEELKGSFVFVCAHNNRDRRCGVCGPILIKKIKEEAENQDFRDSVFVFACSHVGGHKYAGNVITFRAGPDGKVAGNWYGYVTPNDVPDLVVKQIGRGEIIDKIWRGQMGANVKESEKLEEPKLADEANTGEKQPQELAATERSCCQGTKGFTCCMDNNVEKKPSNWMGKWEQRHVLTTVAVVGALGAVAVAYGFFRRAK